ncbi:UDP-N-acetylmuramate dehydrogenase [Pseudidiomarina woesei]|uniref:UDP-N-acetylenolpyruvoylglucosamine reductase n=1 Tax=Pseudidiomarina woesei TaxID=1381080 RepID=A0A0K6GZR9_9GAMM|nr:UDP-N-acetylmuramate dehydrogenase [Pseudidiomarina woesei]CUA84228.1 UDP-N-acetylmuramate dehydrogenase [Pseudidiomarina woesei]
MNQTYFSTDLKPLHSFRLHGKAHEVISLKHISQLSTLPQQAYVLGEGSNTIFLDDFAPPIVKVELKGLSIKETEIHWKVSVGAGENWHNLVSELLNRGIFGFENLALIPGTVGAAPVQNIGAYGREVSEFIEIVYAWDRQANRLVEFTKQQCNFAYRDSIFKKDAGRWLIVEVKFAIPKQWQPEVSYGELRALGSPVTAQQIFDEVIATRRRKLPDPEEIPNAGSFFKNPIVTVAELQELLKKYPKMPNFDLGDNKVKLAAGWLIDNLGLKGFSTGQAAVHKNQALVLVNLGEATAADLLLLARTIRGKVIEAYGVELEAEVRLLGRQGLITL